ncbi:uncharacterized protein LOC124662453 [Lolium rigidum]|uniref:uncharacterized protein LOC124662453 n=1 Tax=Lolium rigidum TaxID=89674 RepID=UPI001F5CBACD|nr:uncharacterized protein LOC124662453 [Lolium rigidum]
MAPGSKKKKKKKGVKGSPVDKLTDDILADIFSRVPYKSSRCCKCVSTRWRDLFSHPDHRKKMPQSIAGFFYEDYNADRFPKTARYFINIPGKCYHLIDPSLSFLPKCERLDIMDCCNGLLLCRCWKETDPETVDYVVCNPATKKWVVVPSTEWSSKVDVTRLGFDSAVSAHFHVFEFIREEGQLHFTCSTDSESDDIICQESSDSDSSNLLVWVLEDYSTEKWTLKHTVSHLRLFRNIRSGQNSFGISSDVDIVGLPPELGDLF